MNLGKSKEWIGHFLSNQTHKETPRSRNQQHVVLQSHRPSTFANFAASDRSHPSPDPDAIQQFRTIHRKSHTESESHHVETARSGEGLGLKTAQLQPATSTLCRSLQPPVWDVSGRNLPQRCPLTSARIGLAELNIFLSSHSWGRMERYRHGRQSWWRPQIPFLKMTNRYAWQLGYYCFFRPFFPFFPFFLSIFTLIGSIHWNSILVPFIFLWLIFTMFPIARGFKGYRTP